MINLDQMLEVASANGPVAVVTNPRAGLFEIRVALQPGRWVSRSFKFSPHDPLRERNRTVALAIAAMTPEWRLPQPLPEPDPEPESAATVPQLGEAESSPISEPVDAGVAAREQDRPEPTPASSAAAEDAGVPQQSDAGPPVVVQPQSPPAVASSPGGLGVELAALGSTWPLGAGGQVGADYCSASLCLGLLLRGQRSDLGPAQSVIWHAGGQLVGRVQTELGGDRLRAALQLAIGPGWVLARRGAQSQDRWQLEVDLDPELAVRVFAGVWLFLRGGAEIVSGPTPVFVNAVQVAELPVVSGHVCVGLRVGP